jgi:hypothetical protein
VFDGTSVKAALGQKYKLRSSYRTLCTGLRSLRKTPKFQRKIGVFRTPKWNKKGSKNYVNLLLLPQSPQNPAQTCATHCSLVCQFKIGVIGAVKVDLHNFLTFFSPFWGPKNGDFRAGLARLLEKYLEYLCFEKSSEIGVKSLPVVLPMVYTEGKFPETCQGEKHFLQPCTQL